MKKRSFKFLSVALIMAGLSTLVFADIVVMVDGTRLEGRVEPVGARSDRVALISGTGRIELPKKRIKEVIEEDDATDWSRIGAQYLITKNYEDALRMFQKSLELNPGMEAAQSGLKDAQGAIELKNQELQREFQQKMDVDLEEIADVIKAEQYDEKKFEDIARKLNEVLLSEEANDNQRQSARRLSRDLYLLWGFALFDRLDNKGAEDKYLKVQEMDPENEEARKKLLDIWQNDSSKRPEVLKARMKELNQDPNNLELNKVVGDLLYESRLYEEAIPPLMKVNAAPRFEGQGYDYKLKTSFQFAVEEAMRQQKIEEAINMLKEMFSLGLTQDRTQIDRLNYELAVSKLPDSEDYWNMRARLARERLSTPGLGGYKERELELILRSDPENLEAQQAFREIAEALISNIQNAFNGQDYLVARQKAEKFLVKEQRFPDLRDVAQDLYNRADIEAQRLLKQQREVAKQLADNAQVFYDKAQRDVQSMITQERLRQDASNATYNYMNFKSSAIRNLNDAIDRWDMALEHDPSLGGVDSMDLKARISDANRQLRSLQSKATPLPKKRNR
jgi:hypothetical protein